MECPDTYVMVEEDGWMISEGRMKTLLRFHCSANDPDFTASSEGSEPNEVGTGKAELINGDDLLRHSARPR